MLAIVPKALFSQTDALACWTPEFVDACRYYLPWIYPYQVCFPFPEFSRY